MAKLRGIVGDGSGWTLIGSSLGGLMATALALERPSQIARLILLAPALPWLPADVRKPLDMPVTVYHGRRDELVSLEKTREVARQIFTDLRFDEVDDDHGLGKTAREIDWAALLED